MDVPSDPRLTAHLAAYLGAWPPGRPLDVVGSPARLAPAWDGGRVPAVAVASPVGTVVSVPPDSVAAAAKAVAGVEPRSDELGPALAGAIGLAGRASPWVVFRWTATPAPLPDVGRWVANDHPALPDWLRPFPGEVLVTFDERGEYVAGVGIKRHTESGRELAVGTTEAARGLGYARRLVAQAARAVLADGAIPLYVHVADNLPSARVADAAGFPDLGWRLLAVWGRDEPGPA
jgi:GNAT superfamily N-acetyltransferase